MSPSAPRRPCTALNTHSIRAVTGFCILGIVTTVVPFIISSASYLIIPYPRPLVLAIETLPALAVKLLLPTLLLHLPRLRLRLPSTAGHVCSSSVLASGAVAALFTLAAVVTASTPPNVPPPVRVGMTALASAATAAIEVVFVGRVRRYGADGRAGLAGWGIGTGAGAALCAVLPLVLTTRLGLVVRDAVACVQPLAVLMLIACWLVLPPTRARDSTMSEYKLGLDLSSDDLEPLMPDASARLALDQPLWTSWKLVRPFVRTCMLPLFLASAVQSATYPGISRAHAHLASFTTYASFSASLGLASRAGSLVSRSSLLFVRVQGHDLTLTAMCVLAAVPLFLSSALFPPSALVVLAPACAVGLGAGLVYVNVLARAAEQLGRAVAAEADFCIATFGVGDTLGVLLGSVLASLLEAHLCATDQGSRWCHSARQ